MSHGVSTSYLLHHNYINNTVGLLEINPLNIPLSLLITNVLQEDSLALILRLQQTLL